MYHDYLRAATRALTEGGLKHLSDLRDILDTPLIADTRMVRMKNGRTYYTLKHMVTERVRSGHRKVQYICDGSGATKNGDLNNREIDRKTMFQPSPQNLWAGQVLSRMRQFDGTNWETFYLDIAELILRQDDMDPILSASLLKIVLSYSETCSPIGFSNLSKARTLLTKLDLDVAWMDPDDSVANTLRPQAFRTVEDVAPLVVAARKEIEAEVKSIPEHISPYQAVGILLEGHETITPPPDIDTTELYVLWDDPGEGLGFLEVGSIVDGKAKINPLRAAPYPQGSLLLMSLNWNSTTADKEDAQGPANKRDEL